MGLWGGREALTAIVMSEEVAMTIRKVLAAEETIHGPTLGREQRPEALLDGKDAIEEQLDIPERDTRSSQPSKRKHLRESSSGDELGVSRRGNLASKSRQAWV